MHIEDALTGPMQAPATAVLFRKVLCAFVLLNLTMLLPVAGSFWGPDALVEPLRQAGFSILRPWNLLASPALRGYWWLLVAALYLFAALGFVGKWVRLSLFMTWLLSVNLTYAALDITNGGYHLVNLLLFACFVMGRPSTKHEPETNGEVLANLAANLGFFGARFQIALVYAFAGMYKLFGADWVSGDAIYYILNVDAFSMPWLKALAEESGLLLKLITWGVMGYQLAFPVLIWFKKLRWPVLIAGTCMHLFIAFGMGLVDFGFAMIAAYVVFYPNAYAEKLLLRLGGKRTAG